ncbi:bacterioferritin [Gammaproteobacteria bacterium AH-315-C21]|nr:bacterioferritin [Gammaproteobacteria bacterium AH-315-C21]
MDNTQTILGFLGRALSFEFSAVQQYLSLAKLMEVRGMPAAGEKFRHEANEEMRHVERIIGRMLALGGAPNASCLRPSHLDGSLPELMQHAKKFELEIVGFYTQAVHYSVTNNDHDSRIFFEELLQEEQAHVTSFDNWWKETVGS